MRDSILRKEGYFEIDGWLVSYDSTGDRLTISVVLPHDGRLHVAVVQSVTRAEVLRDSVALPPGALLLPLAAAPEASPEDPAAPARASDRPR